MLEGIRCRAHSDVEERDIITTEDEVETAIIKHLPDAFPLILSDAYGRFVLYDLVNQACKDSGAEYSDIISSLYIRKSYRYLSSSYTLQLEKGKFSIISEKAESPLSLIIEELWLAANELEEFVFRTYSAPNKV